jgi:hypothetical protein
LINQIQLKVSTRVCLAAIDHSYMTTLFYLIGVGLTFGVPWYYRNIFTNIIVFYQLNLFILFGVHTTYLCYLGKHHTLSRML